MDCRVARWPIFLVITVDFFLIRYDYSIRNFLYFSRISSQPVPLGPEQVVVSLKTVHFPPEEIDRPPEWVFHFFFHRLLKLPTKSSLYFFDPRQNLKLTDLMSTYCRELQWAHRCFSSNLSLFVGKDRSLHCNFFECVPYSNNSDSFTHNFTLVSQKNFDNATN